MAFSMFFRKQVCSSRLISQPLIRLTTQTTPIAQSRLLTTKSLQSLNFNEVNKFPLSCQLRGFQTSSVRMSDEKAHDHSKLWVIEKAVTLSLVPLIPAALLMPNKLLDAALAILITAHSFWGLEAIAVDYVRASVFGTVIAKAAIILVYLLSITTLGGMFYIIGHDVGIANLFKQLWSVKANENKS